MIKCRGAMFLGAIIAVTALLASGAEAQRGGGGPGGGASPGAGRVMPDGQVVMPNARVVAGRGVRGGPGPGGGVFGSRTPGPGRDSYGRSPARGRRSWGYDSTNETSITGVVVDSSAQGAGAALESAVTIRTAEGEVRRVRLGPAWYLDHVGLAPKLGDSVEVLGTPSMPEGARDIIAREVEWEGERYRLRAERGAPLWAGASDQNWMRYGDVWDPNHRETITGEIYALESMTPSQPGMGPLGERHMGQGVAVQVALKGSTRELVRVHLGPAWFVEEELPDLQLGQEITVSGSAVRWPYGPVLVAEEVQRGEHRVRLRAQNGRPAWAGGWQNWDGWGPGSRYGRMWDPQRVRTISGVVERAGMGAPWGSMGSGLMLTVRTREQEQVRAHVGPAWFVEQAGIEVVPGDEVTLTGSVIGAADQQMMMVQELQMEEQQFRLREADGAPVWIGAGLSRGPGPGAGPGMGRGRALGRGRGAQVGGMRGRARGR